MFQVKFVVCSTIEKKDNYVPLKLDILQKHVGCSKVVVATNDVVVGEWFYYKDASHNKNKRIYIKRGNESILNMVHFDVLASHSKKLIQFANIFHLLSQGQPMIEFVMFKDLYNLWRLKNIPKKHWIDMSGWGMAENMHDMLENKKFVVQEFGFFTVSVNEMTSIDNQQWINAYICSKKMVRIQILPTI